MRMFKGKVRIVRKLELLNTTLRYDYISENDLLSKIRELNTDDTVDGILVQVTTAGIY